MTALDNNQLLGDKLLESGHNLKQNNKKTKQTPQKSEQKSNKRKIFHFCKTYLENKEATSKLNEE